MDKLECSDTALRTIAEHLPDVSTATSLKVPSLSMTTVRIMKKLPPSKDANAKNGRSIGMKTASPINGRISVKKVQYERRFFQLKEPLDELSAI